MEQKVKDLLKKDLAKNSDLAKELLHYLNFNLNSLFMETIPVSKFLENEKDLLEIGKSLNVYFEYGKPNNLINGKLAGLPTEYVQTSSENNKNFNSLINDKENNKLKSIENYKKMKGYDLDLIKFLFRTTDFNKGRKVQYKQKDGTVVIGTIYSYYLGNSDQGFPLKYKIEKEDGKTTDISYLNKDLQVL